MKIKTTFSERSIKTFHELEENEAFIVVYNDDPYMAEKFDYCRVRYKFSGVTNDNLHHGMLFLVDDGSLDKGIYELENNNDRSYL